MENASKALIMAGSILIALLTIGALIFMFDSISQVEMQKDQNAEIDSVLEFNRQFEAFDTVGLRGTDILSVINKMIDYNKSNDVQVQGYSGMTMKITFSDSNIDDEFKNDKTLEFSESNKETIGDLSTWFEPKEGSNKIEANNLDAEQEKEFKRKYFRCTNVEYDNNTGRVIRMEFKEIDVS